MTLFFPILKGLAPFPKKGVRALWDKLKQSMRDFHLELTQSGLATTDVRSLRDKFVTRLQQGTDKFIPARKASAWDGFPRINQEIRRLIMIRKRDKLYKCWSSQCSFSKRNQEKDWKQILLTYFF